MSMDWSLMRAARLNFLPTISARYRVRRCFRRRRPKTTRIGFLMMFHIRIYRRKRGKEENFNVGEPCLGVGLHLRLGSFLRYPVPSFGCGFSS